MSWPSPSHLTAAVCSILNYLGMQIPDSYSTKRHPSHRRTHRQATTFSTLTHTAVSAPPKTTQADPGLVKSQDANTTAPTWAADQLLAKEEQERRVFGDAAG